ncbi:MAG: hypothetical protein J0I43_06825 [Microbacterium sp.]|uniref:hypothetical protein n=1 Tax=Microbacterium sp. TaxID=51671 RepID=UPI001AD4ABA1|nr:hypothetical protein [Microbacterium sp.]MBN9177066.1 hypothetical protein [Microbacterium sp.]
MTDEKNTFPPADSVEDVPEAADAVTDVSHETGAETSPRDPQTAVSPDADAAASADPDVTFESVADAFAAVTDGPDAVDESAAPQYGVGPFSVREVALGGVWLVAFIVSFFPIYGTIGAGISVWNGGIDWVLTIGASTVAVFLIALRRLSPQGIRRVGSLGIDQFASVTFTVSTIIWLGILWSSFVNFFGSRIFVATWVVWVEFILMLAGVLLTVFAPLFPTIGEDFRHRTEVTAHRFASPARPVVARPHPPRPQQPAPAAASAPVATDETVAAGDPAFVEAAPAGVDTANETTVIETAAEPAAASPASQAFWALAPEERVVVDEGGTALFTIGPTAWALVIEDRGDHYVVRHEDGRIGYLTDVSGVTRG